MWKRPELNLSRNQLEKQLRKVQLTHLVDNVNRNLKENPYKAWHTKSKMWEEQTLLNFPLLYLASIVLYRHAKDKGCDTILFATRDGCHWHRIFRKMFPDVHVHYFDCSRNMLEGATVENNQAYNEYVASLLSTPAPSQGPEGRLGPSRAVYVDIHGTGKRMFNYFSARFKNEVPYCFLLTAIESHMREMPQETQKWDRRGKVRVLCWNIHGGPIEMLNYDLIGTLQNYRHLKGAESGQVEPVRDELEYPKKYIKPYHKCMNLLISQIQPCSDVLPLLNEEEGNSEWLAKILKIIDYQCGLIKNQKPIINNYIDHEVKHKAQ